MKKHFEIWLELFRRIFGDQLLILVRDFGSDVRRPRVFSFRKPDFIAPVCSLGSITSIRSLSDQVWHGSTPGRQKKRPRNKKNNRTD